MAESAQKPYQERQRRFLVQGLLTLLFCAALALGYFFLLRDPSLVSRDFPVALPESRVTGQAGDVVRNDPITLRVMSVERVPSERLDLAERLGARAKPGPTVDYLILGLELRNQGAEAIPFAYAGSSQTVDVLLGRRRPSPSVKIPAYPEEAALITGAEALPAGDLRPGETVEGMLVFPINQASKDLSLLVLPATRFRDDPNAFPAFEISLEEYE